MKKLRIAMTMLAAGACAAWADTEVERTCEMALTGRVRIENTAGSVDVQSWTEPKVQVKARLEENVKRMDVSCSGSRTTIKVVVPSGKRRRKAAYLTVYVPEQSSLDIEAVSASITVQEVLGKLELESVSGGIDVAANAASINARSISGRLRIASDTQSVEAESTSGTIDISGRIPRVRAETVSGKLKLQGDFNRVEVDSVSGAISVTGTIGTLESDTVSGSQQAGTVLDGAKMSASSGRLSLDGGRMTKVEMDTVSGGIEFRGDLADEGSLDIDTISGRITVEMPPSIGARFEVSTLSGSIGNDFGVAPQRVSAYGPGLELRFEQGNGSGDVTIESKSGGIDIKTR